MTAGIHSGAAGFLPACRKESRTADGISFRQTGSDRGQVPEGVRVIGKITAPHGERVEPLIRYLYGPGRREEHTDPHILAGWRHPAELEPPLRENGRRDFRSAVRLAEPAARGDGQLGVRPAGVALLDARRARGQDAAATRSGRRSPARSCTAPGWHPYGEDDDAVRWVAIRHGEDHIHIVAMLARQDGRRPQRA